LSPLNRILGPGGIIRNYLLSKCHGHCEWVGIVAGGMLDRKKGWENGKTRPGAEQPCSKMAMGIGYCGFTPFSLRLFPLGDGIPWPFPRFKADFHRFTEI